LVCPYCSTDMQPIELNGKTFCSNCGLTIGAADNTVTDAISNFPLPPTDLAAPPKPAFPEETLGDSQTPIKDEAKTELGIDPESSNLNQVDSPITDVQNEQNASQIDQPLPPEVDNQPIKLKVNTEPETPVETDLQALASEFNDQTEDNEPTVESPQNNLEPELAPEDELPVAIPADNTNNLPEGINQSDSLVDKIDIPTEADFNLSSAENSISSMTNTVTDDKTKEIDTLGASGILLDILGDNLETQQRQEKLDSLKAAEDLLDDIKMPKDKVPKTSVKITKAEPKILSDILEGTPQNPEEKPELRSPLDTPEVEKVETDGIVSGKDILKEAELYSLPEKHVGMRKKKTKKIEGSDNQSLSTNTKESKGVEPQEDVPPVPEIGAEQIEQTNEIENKTEIGRLEREIKKAETDIVELTDDEKSEYDPSTLPTENDAKTEEDTKTNKQAILTEYFKTKMTKKPNYLKDEWGRETKKSAKTKPRSWILPTILSSLFLIILSSLGFSYIFFYKTPTVHISETQNVSTFTGHRPTFLLQGYQLSDTQSGSDSLALTYVSEKDTSSTIIYTEKRPTDMQAYISSFTSKPGVNFVTKEVGDISYTEINGNTLVWTKDDYVYSIEATNYKQSVNLLYQMAQSVN
jgi:hypothetical protein